MKWKKNLFLIFFIVAGIVLGAMLASFTAQVPFLAWLSYGKSVGISPSAPFVLDLSVIQISFGFQMGINVAQIITITIAILLYRKLLGKL